ncbi:MAG: hypothetical protein HY727_15215 [Candidatus Rokubacteria bacterium]|nr:hypothetical protein [Candidatus Rokubacteria bacterium]
MLGRWRERYQAWRRGERRVAPASVRGRVYERGGERSGTPAIDAKTRSEARLSMRLYRAAEHCWYRVDRTTGALTRE